MTEPTAPERALAVVTAACSEDPALAEALIRTIPVTDAAKVIACLAGYCASFLSAVAHLRGEDRAEILVRVALSNHVHINKEQHP